MTPGQPKDDVMYCSRGPGGVLRNFHHNPLGVRMTFTKDPDVLKVRLIPDEERGTKWCWHEFSTDRFFFVFDTLEALTCCFAYGLESAEENKKGVRVRARVAVLEVLKAGL